MGYNKGLDLGQLIHELEQLKPDTHIRFDFSYFSPKGFHSYRGYYEDMGIGYEFGNHGLSASDYAKELRSYLGQTMEGYKGGTYFIKETTGLWVSPSSREATGTMITGVRDLEYGIAIIETGYEA